MSANYTPPPRRRLPRDSAGYIPWWLLGMVAGVFVVGALILLALVVVSRPAELPQATASAVVITAAPVNTSEINTPTLQSPPTQAPEAGTATAPPPPPGVVGVGAYVQVVGTGEAGFLNLRSEPNIEAPVNYLAADRDAEPLQLLEAKEAETQRASGLDAALDSLDARSRRIVEARWLREKDPATLHDLAAEFKVSAERIRQIEAKALEKMRKALPAPA